jgi:HPt (histidine-containing phosphotransfer) domain-containing protein
MPMPKDRKIKDRKISASVTTYGDHEVITPPNKLRMAVSAVKAGEPEDDPVARAEAALAGLSSEFNSWMVEECDRLDVARKDVKEKGFNKATRDALFHAAHDIKGEAATFGFPDVAPPADSLCRLLEHTPDMTRIPFPLIDQHVDTMRAIIREYARPNVAAVAEALNKRLREVTDEFLAHTNRDRPEYLKTVLAPSMAPAMPGGE